MTTDDASTRGRRASLALLITCLCLLPTRVFAEDEDLRERVERLEREVEAIESDAGGATSTAGGWERFVRVGGSANVGYYGGEGDAGFDPDSFRIWDTRLFLDAHLGDRVAIADHTVLRNVALSFEWDLVRIGALSNRVGELYVDFQGVAGLDALNVQAGRFQLPVGEGYLRFSQGYARKPFISNPVGSPWWWDEGVRIYGSHAPWHVGWVASVTDGETSFNDDSTSDKQVTLKLYWEPVSWLHLSVSGLRSGAVGSNSSAASGALWLGEAWARAFGAGSSVPNYQHGIVVPDGPNELDDTWFVGGDAIVDLPDKLRVWVSYGRFAIDSAGGTRFDRVLHTWIGEAVFRGAWASPVLRPFFVGVRAAGLGTYRGQEGYLLDSRRRGDLGYNMKAITDYSVVLGWEMTDYVRLRLEYTHRDIDLVSGVSAAIADAARDADFFGVEVGASF